MPGKVRNMLTIGGPHMGVDAVPNCISGFICDIVNFVAKLVGKFSAGDKLLKSKFKVMLSFK